MGCIISGSEIRHSILSPGVRVHSYCDIEDSILMYNATIHRHARIKKAILDREVEVPAGAVIGYDPAEDRRRHTVSDGGVVVVTAGEECYVDPQFAAG
jgi:glucose-1-phosphate adenylyltransferase